MESWWFLTLEFAVAISLLFLSPKQPFPGPSRRFGWILLIVAALLLIGETSPRPTSVRVHLFIIIAFGSIGLLRGIKNMVKTREEVIVAPFSGILFSIGATALIAQQWGDLSKFEEYAGFGTIVLIGAGQTWLVFRGLLIGRLPLAWSKAGLLALERGNLSGPHGAIECFERAWDLEEEHLNPMAWLALEKIHIFLDSTDEADHWRKRLNEVGGNDAVAPEWIAAIEKSLEKVAIID